MSPMIPSMKMTMFVRLFEKVFASIDTKYETSSIDVESSTSDGVRSEIDSYVSCKISNRRYSVAFDHYAKVKVRF